MMCTRVVWPDANGAVIVGRNMDFHKDLMTNLWLQPRGIARDDGVKGDLKWVSRYGSVVATAFDFISVDGMNEAGLAGHILWLTESDYGAPDASRTQLSQAVWLQYFLDNFSTVAEAVGWITQSWVQVVQMTDPTGGSPPVIHLSLDDAKGDSCIIEYSAGRPVVYHSPEYLVMTNSPTFDQQLELVRTFSGLGGDQPLPGSTQASDRFARASYYVSRLSQPASQTDAVAAMFSVMRNVAQPFRIPDPGKPDASQTLWQTVMDLTHRCYVFESMTRPNIVWVNFDDIDLSSSAPQAKLDLVNDLTLENGIVGNVSRHFQPGENLKLLTLEIMKQMIRHGQ